MRIEVISRSALRAERIDTIGNGIQVDRNERVRICAPRHRRAEIQIDGRRRRAGHQHDGALCLEELLRFEADGKGRLRLPQPCGTRCANWWMSGIDRDRQPLERLSRIDCRRIPHAKRELPLFP